jgi:hypothetical protein
MPTTRIRWTVLAAAGLGAQACAQCETSTLLADVPSHNAQLGTSVDFSGTRLVVGEPEADDAQPNGGAATLYRKVGDGWTPISLLVAEDAESFDDFGRSVAFDGDVVVVGAPGKDLAGDNEGAAYVFRDTGGAWPQEQRLTPTTPAEGDRFGWSVDVEGDVCVIGAFGDDEQANSAGAAYVFRFDGEAWQQEAKLLPSDPAPLAQFGRSVAIDGDRVLVGAWQDDEQGFFTGSAYSFVFDGEAWQEEDKLLADDGAAFRWFGLDLDLDGAVAIVGAYGDEEVGGLEAGAAYVFELDGAQWVQADKLLAADAEANARFGWAVAIDGASAWVGATGDSELGAGAGAAYHFRLGSAGWTQRDKIAFAEGGEGAELGAAVAANDDVAVVGAPLWDADGDVDAGAAIVVEGCACPADFNADGALNVLDFVTFQLAWVARNPGADCDDNGNFNVLDFVCYNVLFVAGCP